MPGRSAERFDAHTDLLDLVERECVLQTGSGNLSRDIAARMQLELLSGPSDICDPGEFVRRKFSEVHENLFKELKRGCLSYCRGRVHDTETAEDVAQEAIMCLLKTAQPIKDPKAWLYRVCHNLLVAHYQNRSDAGQMLSRLEAEARFEAASFSTASQSGSEDPDISQIPELAESEAYKALIEMNTFKKLGDYALAKGITLLQAKQQSKQLKKDIKAQYLRYLGWKATPDILSYTQYKAIQRYIRQLVACVGGTGKRSKAKNSFLPSQDDLDKCFANLTATTQWNIYLRDNGTYTVYLECLNAENTPVVVDSTIRIKPNHRIETIACRRLEPLRAFDLGRSIKLPVEKGVITLSLDEMMDFLAREEALNIQNKEEKQKLLDQSKPLFGE